jgi:hypothetical protein
MPRVTINDLLRVGRTVIRMVGHYHGRRPKTEMLLDLLLYGFLEGEFGKFARQTCQKIGNSARPKRIDYRQGGNRPVAIEFAVRTQGRNEIAGSQNRSEINKLARLPQSRWGTRILLLIDLAQHPIARSNLEPTYRNVRTGRGKFRRHSVSVVYVHPDSQYRFLWRHRR